MLDSAKISNILSIVFRLINPFKQKPESILFPAYLKGFRDNFDATWNETNYVGRSESFYIYNKFKRSVTFNLDIPCFNRNELFANYKSLGILASYLLKALVLRRRFPAKLVPK